MDVVTQKRLQDIWTALEDGAAGKIAALRHMTFCTCDADGADARMVILREASRSLGQLVFYSDARAAKARQLERPAAAVFWDPAQQLQIRVRGTAQVLTDAAQTQACWERIGDHGRQNYRAATPPGTAVDTPEACAKLAPSSGREHFAVIALGVHEIDALWLDRAQRLRAVRPRGAWVARWAQA